MRSRRVHVALLLALSQVALPLAETECSPGPTTGLEEDGAADWGSSDDAASSCDGDMATEDAGKHGSHDGGTGEADSGHHPDAGEEKDARADQDAGLEASSEEGGPSADDGSATGDAAGAGDADAGADSGGCASGCSEDAGSIRDASGETADAADASDGASDASGDAGPVATPVLSILAANQSGTTGADLLLTVEASSDTQGWFGLDIEPLSTAGAPIVVFPNWSGVPTYSQRIVLFDDTPASPGSFIRTVTLPGMMASYPSIHSLIGSLASAGGASNALTTSVTLQAVRGANQSCDPKAVRNRCSSGLACSPLTATCTPPGPPDLTQFVYLSTSVGGKMLFAGNDSANDLSSIFFQFLDAAGQPVAIDLDGSGTLVTSYDESVSGASSLGQFFLTIQSAPPFDQTVTGLIATPSGSQTGVGNSLTAMLEAPPAAATGAACDPRGFMGCVAGDVCVSGVCETLTTALTNAAAGAPTLDPTLPEVFATGYALGANLWGDPPSGCAGAGVSGFPEGIVLLNLPVGYPSLTITTSNQETNVGAAIFVLDGTGAAVAGPPLGCASGYPATLTLSNVWSGTYTIVIESTTPGGGNFGVSIQ